jgi:Ca-activated chloride channel family protein
MRRKGILNSVACIPLLLLALIASAQDYKIRAKVDLVEVPVTVKGHDDRLITGLTQKDFVILEDGRPQTISNFTADPVPLSAVVVIDTGLSTASLLKIQNTFPALAGAFSDFDEIAVYRYDKFVTKVLDFSKDLERVQTAMNTLRNIPADSRIETDMARGPFSVPGPVINGAAVVPPGQVGVFVTLPKPPAKVLNDAIFEAASDLGKRERNRRKVVLVISDGQTTGNDHSFDETTESLLQKGVQVYAIGLDQPAVYRKLSVLDEYAKTTGGDVYFASSTKNIEQAYAHATEEARNQYVIGYISDNEVAGPGPVFREIQVQLSGRNIRVIHRKGYYQYP